MASLLTSPKLSLTQLHEMCTKLHIETLKVAGQLAAGLTDMSVDEAGMLKQTVEAVEEARKLLNKEFEVLQARICRSMLSDITKLGEPLVGEHWKAEAKPEMKVPIPTLANDPNRFYAMHEWIGTPKHLVRQVDRTALHADAAPEILKVSFDGIQAMLVRLQAEGKPYPSWVGDPKTWVNYRLSLRKVRNRV